MDVADNVEDSLDGSADPIGQAVTRQLRVVILLHWDTCEKVMEEFGNIKAGTDECSGVV